MSVVGEGGNSEETFEDAIGLDTYSNSESIVFAYPSTF
jgi:hypothetical protein